MEIVAFIVIGIFIFCMGWMAGNIVEWSITYRERRLNEAKIADLMNEMYHKERQARE